MSNAPNPENDLDDVDEYFSENMYDDPSEYLTEADKDMPREAWWNQHYADFHDYPGNIQKLLDETYKAIDEGVRRIKRHEDDPLIVRYVLEKVRRRLAALEVEINALTSTNDTHELTNAELTRQRNDAVYQVTVLSRYIKTQHWEDKEG